MLTKKYLLVSLWLVTYFMVVLVVCHAQNVHISHNIQEKKIQFGNEEIQMTLDYNQKANISSVVLNGQPIIEGDSGIYSAIRIQENTYSTLQLLSVPVAKITDNTIILTAITYGNKNHPIYETWVFTISRRNIQFRIERSLSKSITAEQVALPVFTFTNINTWEGAYQDYGGLAWFYLFNKKLDTYGVHSRSSQFWNSITKTGLDIAVSAPGEQIAMNYSRTQNDKLTYTIAVALTELIPRFDSGTNRRRFIRDRTDVWAPVTIKAGTTSETITLSSFDFNERFGRGKMAGINGEEVSAALNTIARIGVIDKQHFGGNSWHTPYGPICLHEQYIAQMGLAINDMNYLKDTSSALIFIATMP